MWRLIVVTFAFLGWSFYELSGGADYAPRAGSLQAEAYSVFKAPEPVRIQVAQIHKRNAPDVARAAVDLNTLPRVNVSLPSIAAPATIEPAFDKARKVTGAVPDVAQTVAFTVSKPEPAPEKDLRQINGNVVNMRMGPGTRFDIVTKLRRGDAVEVLNDPGEGWLKLRVVDSGRIGWMADYLVTAAAE